MRERPILFSGPMVRAILSGQKTQTRRIVKVRGESPPEWATFAKEGVSLTVTGGKPSGLFYWSEEQPDNGPLKPLRRWPTLPANRAMAGDHYWTPCPHGQPGDRLWVRETWAYGIHALVAKRDEDGPFVYRANPMAEQHRLCDRWRPSIHMPRRASRITLEVTGVRVERLQDISEGDAYAEGADNLAWKDFEGTDADLIDWSLKDANSPHRNGFAMLWESINGAGSWGMNPWVWVVEFRRIDA